MIEAEYIEDSLKNIELFQSLQIFRERTANRPIQIQIQNDININAWASNHERYKDANTVCLFTSLLSCSDNTRLFVLAHELGHIELDHFNSRLKNLPWSSKKFEYQADNIAIRALMELEIIPDCNEIYNALGATNKDFVFNTHPSAKQRILAIEKVIKSNYSDYVSVFETKEIEHQMEVSND